MLSLSGISVRSGGIAALSQVSLDAGAGESEVIGIVGPNGSGKTTLFDVISRVRAPDEGRVILDGKDVTKTPATPRARLGLRRTFQRVQPFGWLTVEDNVLAALEWRSAVLADGSPEEIQGNQAVRDAYLGEHEHQGTSTEPS